MKFAASSSSKHDDELIRVLKKPLTLIPLGIGLYALMHTLPLQDIYKTYADLLIKSYFYIAIFYDHFGFKHKKIVQNLFQKLFDS